MSDNQRLNEIRERILAVELPNSTSYPVVDGAGEPTGETFDLADTTDERECIIVGDIAVIDPDDVIDDETREWGLMNGRGLPLSFLLDNGARDNSDGKR